MESKKERRQPAAAANPSNEPTLDDLDNPPHDPTLDGTSDPSNVPVNNETLSSRLYAEER
jgi:hypothetical protein